MPSTPLPGETLVSVVIEADLQQLPDHWLEQLHRLLRELSQILYRQTDHEE